MLMSMQWECSCSNTSVYWSALSMFEVVIKIQSIIGIWIEMTLITEFKAARPRIAVLITIVLSPDLSHTLSNIIKLLRHLIFYSIMQKHQEWLSNRGYIQHLNVLTKIYTRRSPSNNPNSQSVPRIPQDTSGQPPANDTAFVRSKDNFHIKDQQILWDNYHLGKRIIETPPVISKRRLDEQYLKHRRLVHCLTSSNSRKSQKQPVIYQELQEYKENVELLSQDRAIKTATHKYYLRLRIQSLCFYRQRPLLDQLVLVLNRSCKDGRTKKQYSESFPANELLEKNFYFYLPKKSMRCEEALVVEIQHFKGLEELSVGYFSFPSTGKDSFKAHLFHCGKPIGEVVISADCGKKTPRQTAS